MAETFDGPVVVRGRLEANRVDVPGPVRPEPAAQFGSHVGVEGNLDVSGRTNAHDVRATKVEVPGPVRPEPAAQFGSHVGVEGNLDVSGRLNLPNADCAEDFDVAGAKEIEPGTVTVLNQEGALQQSQEAYDKRVAGVVAGAGGYKPGITLDKQQSQDNRIPVALLGKVYCRVDAEYLPVEVGDLLTTSSTPGHAMKAADPFKAFGAVLGKALRPLKEGQGLIPVLVTLQ